MSTDKPIPEPRSAGAAEGAQKGHNLPMLRKLALFALMMFGFGWAMIPLYNAICEVTGINNLTQRDETAEAFAKSTQVDTSRKVTIEFDANIHGPWRFSSKARSVSVHPGELATVEYELANTAGRPMAGQAIPSYAPQIAGSYFRKLECFCFQQQMLEAGQTKNFPVVFVIDPDLPAEVTTITLSYTFFDVGGQVGKAPPPAVASPAKGKT